MGPIRWLTFGVLLGLIGCGFHLRGAASLPPAMQRLEIEGLAPYDPFRTALRRELRANEVSVVEEDATKLRLKTLDRGRRVLSVDRAGRAREFELFTRAIFDVVDQQGKVLIPEQTVSLSREFFFAETEILGAATEEELLFSDMQKELVRLILYRLQGAAQVQ